MKSHFMLRGWYGWSSGCERRARSEIWIGVASAECRGLTEVFGPHPLDPAEPRQAFQK